MVKSTSRRGRPLAIHHPKIGEPVVGLFRLADGRWRASGPEKFTYTEADEGLAISRFLEWKQRNSRSTLGTAQSFPGTASATSELARRAKAVGTATMNVGLKTQRVIEDDGHQAIAQEVTVADPSLRPEQWTWLRRQIIDQPKWVAARVGIEQIAYLTELKAPEPLPTFDSLKEVWKQHATCKTDQIQKVTRAFDDFTSTTKIGNIGDITAAVVIGYQDNVYRRNISAKQQQHLFFGTRRLLRFAKSRALAVEPIAKALQYLDLLHPSESVANLNPQPIDPAEWAKLLASATGENRAMILLMLNGAFYLQEAIDLRWDDIKDGCVVTRRKKKGQVIRVAVLWPQTLEALNAVPRRNDAFIFHNYAGAPLGIDGAQLRFNALAELAGVPHITGSHLRDSAYTAAVAAGVSADLTKLLVGHRTGMQDHYVARRPQLVAPACDAIHRAYF